MLRQLILLNVAIVVACCLADSLAAQSAGRSDNSNSSRTEEPSNAVDWTSERQSMKLSLQRAEGGAHETPRSRVASAKDISLDSQVPSMHVSTAGPDVIVVGAPATYVVTLANLGDVEAREIAVQIALPPSLELQASEATAGSVQQESRAADNVELIWNVDKVPGRAEETLSLIFVARECQDFDLVVNWSVRQTSSSARIAVKEPKLELALAGPNDLVFGKAADWTIQVSNPGTADASNVRLGLMSNADKLGTAQIGTIEAGGTRTLDLNLLPTVAGAGSLRAAALADLGAFAEAQMDFHVRRGKLNVELLGSNFEYAGSDAVYQVRVVNSGNADLEDVALRLALPETAKYLDGPESAVVSEAGVQWDIDRVAPGEESRFAVACKLSSQGNQQFTIQGRTADDLVDSDSVVTQVQAIADLKLDVLDPKGPRPVGDPIEYEIVVTNQGSATARQIRLTATYAAEVEPVDLSGSASINSGQILFRTIDQLDPGHMITRKITVRAHKAGNHPFRVVMQCVDPETRLASDETTRFFLRPPAPQATANGTTSPTSR